MRVDPGLDIKPIVGDDCTKEDDVGFLDAKGGASEDGNGMS